MYISETFHDIFEFQYKNSQIDHFFSLFLFIRCTQYFLSLASNKFATSKEAMISILEYIFDLVFFSYYKSQLKNYGVIFFFEKTGIRVFTGGVGTTKMR